MATITRLPHEVIAFILEQEVINIEDIIRFGSTCTKFQQLIQDNKLCEKKFYQRCSTAKRKYNTKKQKTNFKHIDFKKQIEAGIKSIKKLQFYVFLIVKNKLQNTIKKELEFLLRSIVENSMTYYFVLDEINKIISQLSWAPNLNLTSKYNFGLIYYYLKQYRFIYEQIKFLNMPKKKQLLELQFTIVAQYFQPHVSYSVIKMWLDDIAQEILSRIKIKYPTHSIFSIPLEQFSFWRDNNIDDNFWNPAETMQIMRILEEFIFSELEVYKLHQLWISLNLEDNCLNYISKRFRKYLLSTTYQNVARRFGVRCVLMLIDTGISVVWKPKYNTKDWDTAEYFYMNEKSNLPYPSNINRGRNDEVLLGSLHDTWITREMMIDLYQELIDNHNIRCKWKFTIFFNFLRTCLLKNNVNINVEFEYANILKTIKIKSNIVKKRKKEVKFAVGMIVTYVWQNYSLFHSINNNNVGVIVGWHYKYNHKFLDKLEKVFMFSYLRHCYENYQICTCKQSSNFFFAQPHYIILTENNGICYMHQDNILICSPKRIDNIEIGRFFSRFEGRFYVPNQSLAKCYPNDTAILKILFNLNTF